MLAGRAFAAPMHFWRFILNVCFDRIDNAKIKYEICKKMLESLPEWFGIHESNQKYCDGVKDKTFFCVVDSSVNWFCWIFLEK